MSMLNFSIATPTGGISIASDAAFHTVLQLLAPANQIVKIVGFEYNFEGTATTDPGIEIAFQLQTAATGSGSSAVTPINTNFRSTTIQSTAKSGFTAEPTVTATLSRTSCQPQLGASVFHPFAQEILCGSGQLVGIACKIPSGAANKIQLTVFCEE